MGRDIIRGNVKKMYIFHKKLLVSENHRWPVYGTEPHALYSHACVDACTIYVAYPDGINRLEINFEF